MWWFGVAMAGAPEGKDLFERTWAAKDGLGPLFNDDSCGGCHHQGGLGGAGARGSNVTMMADGMLAEFSVNPGWDEVRRAKTTMPEEMPEFGCGTAAMMFLTQFRTAERQTPSLFGVGALATVPEDAMVAAAAAGEVAGVSGRIARDEEDRPGRLGWKGQTATLDGFVDRACAMELGLSTPTTQALVDARYPKVVSSEPDLSGAQVSDLVAFVGSLPAPPQAAGVDEHPGRAVFAAVGCAACHAEQIGDVNGAYTDLLLHDMGHELADGTAGYGSVSFAVAPAEPREWRTPPLWGVSTTAPYLHDGRASTVEEAIRVHSGEAEASVTAFGALSADDRHHVFAFLNTI